MGIHLSIWISEQDPLPPIHRGFKICQGALEPAALLLPGSHSAVSAAVTGAKRLYRASPPGPAVKTRHARILPNPVDCPIHPWKTPRRIRMVAPGPGPPAPGPGPDRLERWNLFALPLQAQAVECSKPKKKKRKRTVTIWTYSGLRLGLGCRLSRPSA